MIPLQEPTLTYAMFTMPWSRRHARRLELYGKSLGLQVQHEHDDGWTLRFHLLTATGPHWAVKRYSRTLDRWRRLTAGEPVDDRDLLANLAAKFAAKETA